MFKRTALLLAINVAVLCACAELLALAVFYYQHGWLFYTYPYREPYASVSESQAQQLTDVGLHPYFGPIHRAGIALDVPPELRESSAAPARVETNNLGFASPHDYPFVKTRDDQAIVGIFGGSVAAWFCQAGAGRLAADLKRSPAFGARELVPLCFAHEGYKQPQQLLVLAYFLSIGQRFDLVINIDGFNEVAIGGLNRQHGWDSSMPSVMHLDPLINLVNQSTLTPAKIESLAAIARYKERLNSLARPLNRNRAASIDFVLGRYYAFVERRYHEELLHFDRLPSNPPQQSVVHVTPPRTERRGAGIYADIARDWMTSSLLMQQMLAARGVPYVHVLQPNQYYTTRRFSDGEAKVALNAGSPFKEGAETGYPFLEKELESSRDAVNIFNGVHLFDDERAPVYIDDCCHYTLVGYHRLADLIATSVDKVRLKADTTTVDHR